MQLSKLDIRYDWLHQILILPCNIQPIKLQTKCLIKCSPEHFMWSSCMSVRLSVRSHDNSWTRRRRMMKLCTRVLQVKSDIQFEDGSRTWPLTLSTWGSYISGHVQKVHTTVHSVHGTSVHTVHNTISDHRV